MNEVKVEVICRMILTGNNMQFSEKTMSQFNFDHHKCHIVLCRGMKPERPPMRG